MKKKDVILILALLVCAGIGYLIFNTKDTGNTVVITLDGDEYGTYQLDVDKTIDVKSEYGHNLVVISEGKVHIEEADCPDGYCMNQGVTDSSSKSLICLPHKLVVSVINKSQNNDVDVVAK